jgi:hypothetical protein
MDTEKINLGDFVEDRLSGFTGTADGRSEYLLNPTRQIRVVANTLQNGTPQEQWFPEWRLRQIQKPTGMEPGFRRENAK